MRHVARGGGREQRVIHQGGECDRAKAHGAAAEELPAGGVEELVDFWVHCGISKSSFSLFASAVLLIPSPLYSGEMGMKKKPVVL
jgi:hypothetical protein